jgi:hypothetical protein
MKKQVIVSPQSNVFKSVTCTWPNGWYVIFLPGLLDRLEISPSAKV